jgi:hypothetical protein
VHRDDGFDFFPLCRSPQGTCSLGERRPVENKVEDDVHIDHLVVDAQGSFVMYVSYGEVYTYSTPR